MPDTCEQCNKIRALPDSPTKMYMTLDHIMSCVCLAHIIEAPKGAPAECCDLEAGHKGDCWLDLKGTKPEPAKPPEVPPGYWDATTQALKAAPLVPPESEALAFLRHIREPYENCTFVFGVEDAAKLTSLIEADAQRLKEAEQERDGWKKAAGIRGDEAAEFYDRAEKAERERDKVQVQLESVRGLYREAAEARDSWANELAAVKGRLAGLIREVRNDAEYLASEGRGGLARELKQACVRAEAGVQNESVQGHQWELERIKQLYQEKSLENLELVFDRAKWVKVCAERDNHIVELCNLMRRIKDYARQHTQYPFANAIIDLCNQVLEPK